jgi:hypothetical protein
MMTLRIGAGLLLAGSLPFLAPESPAPAAKPAVVGTYDSRAVAVAYTRSPQFAELLKGLRGDIDGAIGRAKAAGDADLVAALEAIGPGMQQRAHLQGFGGAPVDAILARLADRLPAIAQRAGVDVIVSRWALDWQAPGVQFVDVTGLIAAEFQPTAQTLEVIEQLRDKPLVPLDELRKHR